jgi:mRNA-degrading endonuclease YafQ of YafQ-DinJ toxin-antitoxin module
MAANVSDPRLKTHHLSGQLAGLHACSVAYDCRIVFAKARHPKTRAEVLVLVNIGSHEEVY